MSDISVIARKSQIGFLGRETVDKIPDMGLAIRPGVQLGQSLTPQRFFVQQFIVAEDESGQSASHSATKAVDVRFAGLENLEHAPSTFSPDHRSDPVSVNRYTPAEEGRISWSEIPAGVWVYLHFLVLPSILGKLSWKKPPVGKIKYDVIVSAQIMGETS